MQPEVEKFLLECNNRVDSYAENVELQKAAKSFNTESNKAQYSYNFKWMGRPIIQYPQDIIAMQEIIWELKPDVIIETGIAHGGSLIFYASLLELIGKGRVIGVDIDIRSYNKIEIENHLMFKRIQMLEGSSIDNEIVEKVSHLIKPDEKVLVVLDSNHTHHHVLEEMKAYSRFVSLNSYLVVFDTIVEELPDNYLPGLPRPWGKGDNPMTAVNEFLAQNHNFETDLSIDNKVLISVAPKGYLKRIV